LVKQRHGGGRSLPAQAAIAVLARASRDVRE
jgi:hypothetical protein